jgi:hypothetical protein
MNITVTITCDTPAEIMTALQGLSSSMVLSNGSLVTSERQSLNGVKKTPKPEPVPESIAEPVVTVNGGPAITLESVRSLVQAKSKSGKRDGIKALLTEFGVERVTSLEKSQYSEFLTKLEAL